ncbi:MAG: aryl-sulfate sulfotransferase [Desulfatiglandales bacterium]|nr:aryl-sulfate sulfotransferase [Desulfatiglandales bacterium]
MGYPSVYPTGTTIYDPEKCWNGYTLFPAKNVGAALIDMNGRVVQMWKGLHGFPNKLLPGGYVMGSTGERNPKYGYQDQIDIVQVDWDGNIVWKFNKYERIKDSRQKPTWMARQHHDFQREGNPVGYYVPRMAPLVDKGNTLIVCHKNQKNSDISDKLLLDDTIIEVTWDGKIIWEWVCSDHFDEMGFSEEARNILSRHPNIKPAGGVGDWMHINSMSTLGPNKWYDAGDERFHPDNIIWDGRQTNIIAITDRKKGNLVWQVGPDYTATRKLRKLGQIIGQHHAHMIPRGLPGEGNILVFDNGGWGGYGAPNPGAVTGHNNALRDYSRVLEFDPVTLEVVWKYTPTEAGFLQPMDSYKFYSGLISSAQRLPNGNTMITEGSDGRLFEITPEYEIVWEYISPYFGKVSHYQLMGLNMKVNMVYRAYRVPYEWVPQLEKSEEKALPRLDNANFRIPGSPGKKPLRQTKIKGDVRGFSEDSQLCATQIEDL